MKIRVTSRMIVLVVLLTLPVASAGAAPALAVSTPLGLLDWLQDRLHLVFEALEPAGEVDSALIAEAGPGGGHTYIILDDGGG